eukprot:scaffold131378_cov39-Phaeocystis_antarctica.AAC.2
MVTCSPASVSGAKKPSAVQGGAHTWPPVVTREDPPGRGSSPACGVRGAPGPASLGFCLGLPVRGSSRAWRTQRVREERDLPGRGEHDG